MQTGRMHTRWFPYLDYVDQLMTLACGLIEGGDSTIDMNSSSGIRLVLEEYRIEIDGSSD